MLAPPRLLSSRVRTHHRTRDAELRRFLDDPRLSPAVLETLFEQTGVPRTVSAVIATYNRCPHDPATSAGRRNPLRWCLDTLLASRATPLREIIVVNDGSTDHTADVLAAYDGKGIPLRVVTLPQRRGSGPARNKGFQHATSELCLICDDDALPAPFALAAAAHLFTSLHATDPRAAVLQLPVYLRAARPPGLVARARIGRCDAVQGIADTSFHRFPREYLTNPVWAASGLLAPFPITLHSGVFLARRAPLLAVGGFPALPWRSAAFEEADLALRLTDAGSTLWFSPDPRLHVCHLLYGGAPNLLPGVPEHERYGPYALADLIRESRRTLPQGGNRVPPEEWFESKIASRIAVFGARSRRGPWLWALRSFADFVLFNRREFSRTIGRTIASPAARARVWATALHRGMVYRRQIHDTLEIERCPFPTRSRAFASSPSGVGPLSGSLPTREAWRS